MTNEEFLKLAKRTVKDYTTEHLDKSDGEVDFLRIRCLVL